MLVHGDLWMDENATTPRCEFPRESGKDIMFMGGIWMGAFDDQGQLRISTAQYRQNGVDFWPGPFDGTNSITYIESAKWARIWKINRFEIEAFLAITDHTFTNTPAVILEWPAKGNVSAVGADGYAIVIPNRDMAPFVDMNANDVYEPLLGDYPDMKGDQMLWCVYNDQGPAHSQSGFGSLGLGMETHCSAYAYKRGTLADNIIFYEYNILHQSSHVLDSIILSVYADVDLGYFIDDYVGSDSTRSMGYAYNANVYDNVYNDSVPVVATRLLQVSNMDCAIPVVAGGVMYFGNSSTPVNGNPETPGEFYNYMNSCWRNGQHLTNDYVSPGVQAPGTGTGNNTNFAFSGNPNDLTTWTECGASNPESDHRYLVSSKPFQSNPGSVTKLAFALVTTDRLPDNTCPNLDLSHIQTVADMAKDIYCNPLTPVGITNINASGSKLNIYPNPATDMLYVETGKPINPDNIKLFDATGRSVQLPVSFSNNLVKFITSDLASGVYHIVLTEGSHSRTASFIRE
jgi:hypothetical protein